MRIITGLLRAIVVVVLVLGTLLLVFDPRLRDLVVEDLSLLFAWTESSEERPTTGQDSPPPAKNKQESPTVTDNGYTIAPGCALWSVEGLDLYYSPVDTATICVQAPGNPVEAGSQLPLGAEMPPNCDAAPDSVIYCIVGDQLTAETLRVFYERGELQTPREAPPEGIAPENV